MSIYYKAKRLAKLAIAGAVIYYCAKACVGCSPGEYDRKQATTEQVESFRNGGSIDERVQERH